MLRTTSSCRTRPSPDCPLCGGAGASRPEFGRPETPPSERKRVGQRSLIVLLLRRDDAEAIAGAVGDLASVFRLGLLTRGVAAIASPCPSHLPGSGKTDCRHTAAAASAPQFTSGSQPTSPLNFRRRSKRATSSRLWRLPLRLVICKGAARRRSAQGAPELATAVSARAGQTRKTQPAPFCSDTSPRGTRAPSLGPKASSICAC